MLFNCVNGAGEEIRTPESLAAHGLPFCGLKAYASLLENPRVIVDRQLSTPPLLQDMIRKRCGILDIGYATLNSLAP